jgi:hypothetical protein
LRRSFSPSPSYPVGVVIIRPAMNDDDRAEAIRRRKESVEPWRSPADPEPSSPEDALIRALHLPQAA